MSTHTSGEAPGWGLAILRTERGRQVFGLLIGPGLLYGIMIAIQLTGGFSWWIHSHANTPVLRHIALLGFYGIAMPVWLWVVLRFVCREQLANLNRKAGTLVTDLLDGGAIALLSIVVSYGVTYVLWKYFHTSYTSVGDRITRAEVLYPVVFLIDLGPYTWLAAALNEEFVRIMFLRQLWKLGRGATNQLASIALAAVLFGLCHLYQGSTGVYDTMTTGLIMAAYYLFFGRPLAMVFGHGFIDTYLIISGVTQYKMWHHF